MKAQGIRILDMVLIGPVMLYAAYRLPDSARLTKGALAFFGAATVLYNGRNYLLLRQGAPPAFAEGAQVGRNGSSPRMD